MPRYEVKVGSEYQQKAPFFIESPKPPAQAVAIEVSGDNAQLWLGEVDLRKVAAGTVFTAVNGTGQVRMLSREGLLAQAKIEKALTEGTLLQLMV